ncbi:hypothetical protein PILCRDRAFT_827498 [Piloderma croceum F 1598]|uniref:Uncharacterized protein n=1 Tax=Piloderma croceum (strain F 1598) TaxID=765440 RepID=A0A0C3F5U7_PILCF|nr:hypothetical protein PILCRDRAFT_827498 [Piloderma croceum F 1598]
MVGFSDRDNVRGQRWVLHLIKSNDDTLALRTMMAAVQPYTSPGASDARVNQQSILNPQPESYHPKNPQPNPARVRKTPITHGVVREGIYRIASAIRRNDAVGFLELQEDDTIKAVALNEASDGQKWEITYYRNSKFYIKSSLNSHVLALRPSANDSNLMEAVVENGFPTPWTIEPRRDAYFIGVADDELVLDLAENDNVVFRNLSGDTSQRWDLDPVRFQHQPAFQEGMSYLIKNHATGRVIWLTNNRLTCFSHDDGDSALNFTFKNQPDGGTAVYSVRHELWVTSELGTSTTEHSYRFIPTETGGKFYYISADMMSNPPKVMQDSGDLTLTVLYENEKQMWELVPKLG